MNSPVLLYRVPRGNSPADFAARKKSCEVRKVDNNALMCYEYAVKADGQLDLILSMLAKLHSLRSRDDMRDIRYARDIAVTALSEVLNEAQAALRSTHEDRFEKVVQGVGRAITLVERNEFYEAGNVLTRLASDNSAITTRALDRIFKRTERIF
ncbi:MAG: hypothetical protein GKC04_01475 [Methanomicrobiales archaeon]|nr:hypothetical protein [Methanomicrobiales archaeon]